MPAALARPLVVDGRSRRNDRDAGGHGIRRRRRERPADGSRRGPGHRGGVTGAVGLGGAGREEESEASANARRTRLTLPRRSRSAPSSGSRDAMSRRKVHRSRVCTASLSEPATTSPAELRVTAAISASKRTVRIAHRALHRRFGNHRLLDRDQPVVERQPVLLALLDRRRERVVDVVVDMRLRARRGRPSRRLRGSADRRPSRLRGSGATSKLGSAARIARTPGPAVGTKAMSPLSADSALRRAAGSPAARPARPDRPA